MNFCGGGYIGQTVNEEKRERDFFNKNDFYTSKNSKIDKARRKYGLSEGTWTKEVLKRLWCKEGNELELRNRLDYWEVFFIEKYDTFKNGYNSTSGGETKKVLSEETLEKMRIGTLKKWYKYSDEQKQKQIDALYSGTLKYHSKNKNHVKLEISLAISRKQKEFHKNNIVKKGTPKKLASARKVAKLDDDGNILEVYDSIIEATNKNNAYKYGITRACKGKLKTCKGYKWKYIDEYDDEKPHKGYYWHKKLKRWCTKIKFKQKTYTLGYFKNEETASEMYKLAKEKVEEGVFLEWVENKIQEKYELMKKMGEI